MPPRAGRGPALVRPEVRFDTGGRLHVRVVQTGRGAVLRRQMLRVRAPPRTRCRRTLTGERGRLVSGRDAGSSPAGGSHSLCPLPSRRCSRKSGWRRCWMTAVTAPTAQDRAIARTTAASRITTRTMPRVMRATLLSLRGRDDSMGGSSTRQSGGLWYRASFRFNS